MLQHPFFTDDQLFEIVLVRLVYGDLYPFGVMDGQLIYLEDGGHVLKIYYI